MQGMRLPGQLLANLLAPPVLPYPKEGLGQGIGERDERMLPLKGKRRLASKLLSTSNEMADFPSDGL